MDRREFLKTMGAGVVGLALIPVIGKFRTPETVKPYNPDLRGQVKPKPIEETSQIAIPAAPTKYFSETITNGSLSYNITGTIHNDKKFIDTISNSNAGCTIMLSYPISSDSFRIEYDKLEIINGGMVTSVFSKDFI